MLGRGAQRKGDMPYMLFCSYLGWHRPRAELLNVVAGPAKGRSTPVLACMGEAITSRPLFIHLGSAGGIPLPPTARVIVAGPAKGRSTPVLACMGEAITSRPLFTHLGSAGGIP
jgi:hypothetical protein